MPRARSAATENSDLLLLQFQKAGSSKSRSPMRTELPKIESPPTTTAGTASAGAAETSTELPVVTKESHLLNKVAAALPLLPPLPTTEPIDHTKHAGGNQKHYGKRYKVL